MILADWLWSHDGSPTQLRTEQGWARLSRDSPLEAP